MVLLPDVYAEPLLASGEIVHLLPEYVGPAIEIYPSFPPRRSSVPAVRVFIGRMVVACERLQGSGTAGSARANE